MQTDRSGGCNPLGYVISTLSGWSEHFSSAASDYSGHLNLQSKEGGQSSGLPSTTSGLLRCDDLLIESHWQILASLAS